MTNTKEQIQALVDSAKAAQGALAAADAMLPYGGQLLSMAHASVDKARALLDTALLAFTAGEDATVQKLNTSSERVQNNASIEHIAPQDEVERVARAIRNNFGKYHPNVIFAESVEAAIAVLEAMPRREEVDTPSPAPVSEDEVVAKAIGAIHAYFAEGGLDKSDLWFGDDLDHDRWAMKRALASRPVPDALRDVAQHVIDLGNSLGWSIMSDHHGKLYGMARSALADKFLKEQGA